MLKRSREDDWLSPNEDVSNGDRDVIPKYTQIDVENDPEAKKIITCALAPHADEIAFTTYEAYEIHYMQTHVNRCSECHKNLPTEHFLWLHIAENHDPLNEVKRSREEKTYGCFVEGCSKICMTPQKRRLHLVDKHSFPKNYDFFVVNDGLDQRQSMLRSGTKRVPHASTAQFYKQKSNRQDSNLAETRTKTTPKMVSPTLDDKTDIREVCVPRSQGSGISTDVDGELESVTKSMSALRFMPASIRFGRGGAGGFAKR